MYNVKSAIIDLDGTLSDNSHRKHLIEGQNKEWRKYLEKASEDELIENVTDFLRDLAEDHRIVILTMRSDEVRSQTLDWLKNHEIPFDKLIMLSEGRWEISDSKFKREKLDEIEDPVLAIDDKTSNCEVFENQSLRTYTVEDGELIRFHS